MGSTPHGSGRCSKPTFVIGFANEEIAEMTSARLTHLSDDTERVLVGLDLR